MNFFPTCPLHTLLASCHMQNLGMFNSKGGGSEKNICSGNNLQKPLTETTAENVSGFYGRRLLKSLGGFSFLLLRVSGFV